MFCANCGSRSDGGNFCRQCGSALVAPVATASNVEATEVRIDPPEIDPDRAAFPLPVNVPNSGLIAIGAQVPYHPPRVSFPVAIRCFFRGYTVWNARSTRAELWWAILFYFLVFYATLAIDMIATAGVLTGAWLIGSFIPALSLGIRRFHDLGWSGWWYWVGLIPLIGLVVAIPQAFFASKRYIVKWNRSLPKELSQGGSPQ